VLLIILNVGLNVAKESVLANEIASVIKSYTSNTHWSNRNAF